MRVTAGTAIVDRGVRKGCSSPAGDAGDVLGHVDVAELAASPVRTTDERADWVGSPS